MNSNYLSHSAVMRLAWRLYEHNKRAIRLGDCMAAAHKVLRLNEAMQHGLVRFTFQKINGEVRNAIGTLRPDLFVAPPPTVEEPEGLTLVRYYDVEKNGIRSFRAERIVRVAA